MILILEIAVGVFLGFCLLALVFGAIPEWRRQREIARSERRYQKNLEERFKRAEEQGFQCNNDSIFTPLEQLERWEDKRARRSPMEQMRIENERYMRSLGLRP
jgi:hypothetical protein